jgi:hypothetical protein
MDAPYLFAMAIGPGLTGSAIDDRSGGLRIVPCCETQYRAQIMRQRFKAPRRQRCAC